MTEPLALLLAVPVTSAGVQDPSPVHRFLGQVAAEYPGPS